VGDEEQSRLIEGHGYDSLQLFFRVYADLKKRFMQNELAVKKQAGMPVAELNKIAPQFFRDEQAADNQLDEITDTLSTLAVTKEAAQLNEEANSLVNIWISKYFQGSASVISQKEMESIDDTRKRLMEKVSTLPKLNPSQVQAEIDALPPDYPNVRGLQISHTGS
jgi:hypothetical protein